jgi:competence protein ComGC
MQLKRSINNKQSMNRQGCNNNLDLLNNEIECYNCHNFGHKAANCNLENYKADPRIKFLDKKASTWKRKDSEKCDLALSIQKQKASKNIESGCCKHMTGDMDNLMSISKRKTKNVILENDEPGKIKDRGMMSLSNEK